MRVPVHTYIVQYLKYSTEYTTLILYAHNLLKFISVATNECIALHRLTRTLAH